MMIIDRPQEKSPGPKQIGGIEVVEEFIYLGAQISKTGNCEKEIRRRIAMGKTAVAKLTRIWKDHSISKRTKMAIVKTLIFPITTYAAESWTMKMADRRRIDAFEMYTWRRMLRIPWTEKRTNESILQELNITERLSKTIQRSILKYFGHIMRRKDDSLEKLIVQGKIEGKRPRGRSPTRYVDQVSGATGTSVYDCIRTAENREDWRTQIQQI